MPNVAVVYYSATGTNYRLSQAAAQGATEGGAEVRLRRVRELAPEEAIAANPAWKAHHDQTCDVPEASIDDLDWADGIVFCTPTRFGNVASQMKQFMDLTGPLWAQGKLMNKAITALTSASNPHGGQESTLLALYNSMYHWGAVIVPPGYTDEGCLRPAATPTA